MAAGLQGNLYILFPICLNIVEKVPYEMKKILVADDSQFMRTWLKNILSTNSLLLFEEASTGKQAIEVYQRFQPDVVILDITMPEVNGIEAMKEILRIDPGANVIMCTALGQKPLIMEALQIGAKDFVVKPYFKALPSIVNKCLTRNY